MNERILVVDDDLAVQDVARTYLQREGYSVVCATGGREAIAAGTTQQPDAVVLDLTLPDMSGEAVLAELRRRSPVPILMLSGAATTDDRVAALTAGADDYVTKPFDPRELVARVKAVLRRGRTEGAAPTVLSIAGGALEIDLERHAVRAGGQPRDLTPAEFALLAMLAGRPGRVYSRRELASHISRFDDGVSDRIVDSHVARLRAKLGDVPAAALRIETMRGVGYRLRAGSP